MTKVLLMWDADGVFHYLLDCNDEEVRMLLSINDKFLGESDLTKKEEDILEKISDAICHYGDESYDSRRNKDWVGKWCRNELKYPYQPDEKSILL